MSPITFRAATPHDDTLVVKHFTDMLLAMNISTQDHVPDKKFTHDPALQAALLFCNAKSPVSSTSDTLTKVTVSLVLTGSSSAWSSYRRLELIIS